MRRFNPPKKKKSDGIEAALNALFSGQVTPTPESTTPKQSKKVELPPTRPEIQKKLETVEDMEDLFEEQLRSGALAELDALADEEDDYPDEEDSEDWDEDVDEDDEDDYASGRAQAFRPAVAGGRSRYVGEQKELFDRRSEWFDEDYDDDDIHRNPATLFTPLNIGIGVTILGLAGYFGYKHFTKDE